MKGGAVDPRSVFRRAADAGMTHGGSVYAGHRSHRTRRSEVSFWTAYFVHADAQAVFRKAAIDRYAGNGVHRIQFPGAEWQRDTGGISQGLERNAGQ